MIKYNQLQHVDSEKLKLVWTVSQSLAPYFSLSLGDNAIREQTSCRTVGTIGLTLGSEVVLMNVISCLHALINGPRQQQQRIACVSHCGAVRARREWSVFVPQL